MSPADRDAQRQVIYEKVAVLLEKVEGIEEREQLRNEREVQRDHREELRDEAVEPLLEIIPALKKLSLIEPTLKELADAWTSAAWFGKAIKWVAGTIAAFAVIWAAVRLGMSGKHGG